MRAERLQQFDVATGGCGLERPLRLGEHVANLAAALEPVELSSCIEHRLDPLGLARWLGERPGFVKQRLAIGVSATQTDQGEYD